VKKKGLLKIVLGVTLVTVLAVGLPLMGCRPAGPPEPPPESPPEEAPPEVTPPEEEAPPELTPPEEESTMSILTDGTHSWRLKETTFGEQEIETGMGYREEVLEAVEGYVFLQVEFENLSEVDLIDGLLLETTGGEEPRPTKIFLAEGISTVVVADSRGDMYPAVILDASTITFVVPHDGRGFTLYFLDWAPIELDY